MTAKNNYLLLFFLLFNTLTQAGLIKKIDLRDNISNNTIRSITQDKDGFMWFATEKGLNRFDGNSFVNYYADKDIENSISANSLNYILADDESNLIWIATQRRGISAFDKTTETFINYPIWGDKPNSLKAYGITGLCLGAGDDLWIATYQNGLKKLDKKTNIITHYDKSLLPQLKHNDLWTLFYDKENNLLYVGYAYSGLSVISLKHNTLRHYYHRSDNPNSLPANRVNQILKDSQNNIWIATLGGIALFNPESDNFTVIKHDNKDPNSVIDNNITCIEQVNEELWFGTYTGGGVSILNMNDIEKLPHSQNFRNIYANDFEDGLSNPSVLSIKKDHFDNVWIGTNGGGVNVVCHQEPYFKKLTYSPIKGDKNGLSSRTVRAVTYDREGLLWLGTDGEGIDIYDGNEKVKSYNSSNGFNFKDNFRTAITDSKGNIWLGSHETGVVFYNVEKKRFENPFSNNRKTPTYVNCIFEDKKGNILFGTDHCIFKFNPESKEINIFDGGNIRLSDNLIRSISQDKNNNYWIGSEINGMSIVSEDFEFIRNFHVSSGFCSNGITHIIKDSKDNMLVATLVGLAYFYDPLNFEYKVINKSTGLADESVRAVSEGRNGELWFSTNEGLCRYTIDSEKVDNFDYHNNIPQGTFTNGSIVKSSEGVIYFGSQEGICYFDCKNDPTGSLIPNVKITDIKIYEPQTRNNKSEISNSPITEELKLKYNQNTFSIYFSVMDYALKDILTYNYSLSENNEDAWFQTNGENHVTFRNIPPGKYTFKVKAALRNGEFSDQYSFIKVIVVPPFWLTIWAKLLYIFVLISVTLIILIANKRKLELEYQLNLEKENHQKDKSLNDEKLRFYTNIAHELRTPLTLILGPLEELNDDIRMDADQKRKISTIFKSASRLSNLTNEILEFRKSETNNRKLCVRKADIINHITEIVLKYKEFNKNENIDINIICNSSRKELFFDSEVIMIIIDNLISNSLKYTFEGSIDIIIEEVTKEDITYLQIEVKDTGVGIPAESLDMIFERYYQARGEYQAYGTGIGLSLVKNMVTLHEGDIDVKSELNKGTSFLVRIIADNQYPDAIHIEEKDIEIIKERNSDSKPLLLVVEDNYDIREYITHTFIDDFDVIIAENGKRGFETASERVPDIIISDVMMPVMDGLIMTKKIKENTSTCHIPIVLLTAKTNEEDKNEGYQSGADSYLTKPFSAKTLS